MFFDPMYLLYIAPALLLALWAQWRVKSTYAVAQQMPAPLSGAAAARHILDSAGLQSVAIEQIPGQLVGPLRPARQGPAIESRGLSEPLAGRGGHRRATNRDMPCKTRMLTLP